MGKPISLRSGVEAKGLSRNVGGCVGQLGYLSFQNLLENTRTH